MLSFILAALISVTQFYSNRHRIKNKERGKRIISFSAGVAIVYVLLELFPTFTEVAFSINKLVFLAIPLGLIIHHIIEKEIYKHSRRNELVRMLNLEENIFSFIYHMVIGLVIVTFVKESIIQSLLFFIPIASYTILVNLPIRPHPSTKKAIFLSSATFIGVILGILFNGLLPAWINIVMMGLVTGVLLFVVIRHHIPFGRKGEISYFTIGFLVYSIIIVASWYV